MILLIITKQKKEYICKGCENEVEIDETKTKATARAAPNKQTSKNDVANRTDNSKITPSKIDYSSKKFSI